MPTKAQAKTAIDNSVTAAKADMDNILPSAANYIGGSLLFNPQGYTFILDAGGNAATALSWFNTIQTNLTNANRSFTFFRNDRRFDDSGKKSLGVTEVAGKFTAIIQNF